MKKIFTLIIVMSGLPACSTGTLGERGQIWCNERYRENVNWNPATGQAAKNGYMYALAAALVLQAEGPDDKEAQAHYFGQPSRLERIDSPGRTKSGFEVTTFRLKPFVKEQQEEIIIAFAGSNDRSDWITTNLNPFGRDQYDEATAYTAKMLKDPRVQGRKVVLTGISLGGGLAIHVLKNPELVPLIDEAWALNPSPKIYSPYPATEEMKNKTWMAYSDNEILEWGRSGFMTAILSGAYKIEAPESQTAVLGLIESNRIYAHFRWGIARQMLWIADFEKLKDEKSNNAWTEPYAILQDSNFLACKSERPKYKIINELQPIGSPPDYSGID